MINCTCEQITDKLYCMCSMDKSIVGIREEKQLILNQFYINNPDKNKWIYWLGQEVKKGMKRIIRFDGNSYTYSVIIDVN